MTERRCVPFFLLFLGLIIFFGSAAPSVRAEEPVWPSVQGWVTDQAKVLSPDEIAKLTGVIAEVKKKTGSEMAVVTVKTIAPLDDASYANQLFSRLKIGQKGQDNGVLFLLALEEKKTRIEVGYGLEDVLNDGKCGRILDSYVIPFFKQGQWGEGLYNGTLAVAQVIAQKYKVTLDLTAPAGQADESAKNPLAALLIRFVILILFMTVFRGFWPLFFLGGLGRGGGFSGWGGGSGGGGFGGFGGFGGGFSGGGGAGRGF